ncbi:ABC transporter permease subunit [Euryarchaeota archaeon]|nr:ABC transporter permease subunit [Euryarchaeota archaeon]MDA9156230.1 ABC transporter permease subunit [Candidatus Poseidoniaceae archaeon]MDA8609802.1 ABC transporter permease subunit [Euryarchaeota archaeon]MDA8790661.1 ABC transporter permease subunit [Euryarchaeota archaeon]MDB2560637.1 ABC transporter permease subunit [Euryarchaeota archaeon]
MSEGSGRRIRAIAKKEVVEFARDWRTIIAIIVIPLLMFPLLFILFPVLLESEAAELDALELNVVIQSEDFPLNLLENITAVSLSTSFEALPNVSSLSEPGNDLERVRNGSTDALLRFDSQNETWSYAILHLSTSERSNEARYRLLTTLSEWEDSEVRERITASGLDVNETLDPLRWDGDVAQGDVATSGEQAGMVLSLFIPLVLAIWTYSSAIQPSIDMTAGERERGTLEALLCLPCTRIELLMGKWVAVATITGIGVVLQICGLLFAIGYLASSSFIGLPKLSIASVGLIVLSILLFAVMVVAFELALAMRSHSVKEAGSILAPALMLILFPALFTQVINLDGIEGFWFAIPVVNILLALRELLMNRVITEHVLIWVVSSVVYASLAAYYASRQFSREDIVTSLS